MSKLHLVNVKHKNNSSEINKVFVLYQNVKYFEWSDQ